MRRAHRRDAATEGKFFFRSNIDYAQSPEGGADGEIYSPCDNDPQSGLEEMTILEILEGKVRRGRALAVSRLVYVTISVCARVLPDPLLLPGVRALVRFGTRCRGPNYLV